MERRGFIGAVAGAIAGLIGGKAVAVRQVVQLPSADLESMDWCSYYGDTRTISVSYDLDWREYTSGVFRICEVGNLKFVQNTSNEPAIYDGSVRLIGGESFYVARYA